MHFKCAHYILLLVTCCCTAHPVFCQPIENHFTHYTAKDGLADGGIRTIIQDSSGFLWLGCENGLSRFDGNTFKIYRHNPLDTNSLRENRVWNLFIDSKKRLWVMTFHWLYLYHPDGEWFEHFGINRFSEDRLEQICAEENNQLIIAGDRSLYKFDENQKKFTAFSLEGIKPMRFFDYKKDENGIEWIGTGNGLLRYDPKTKKSLFIDSALKSSRR